MKIAIVTGGASGMGLESLKALAKNDFHVLTGTSRPNRAERVIQKLPSEIKGKVIVRPLDLSDFDSIQQFANYIDVHFDEVDVLINNAGVLNPTHKVSAADFDYTIASNYLGHFLLTHLLAPKFVRGSRVVNVTSLTYRYGRISEEFFQPRKQNIPQQFRAYFDSKLAVVYGTLYWAEKLHAQGVIVNVADPGIVGTKIIALNNKYIDMACQFLFRPFIKTPKEGARTAIHLALSSKVEGITGKLYKNKKEKPYVPTISKEEGDKMNAMTIQYLQKKGLML